MKSQYKALLIMLTGVLVTFGMVGCSEGKQEMGSDEEGIAIVSPIPIETLPTSSPTASADFSAIHLPSSTSPAAPTSDPSTSTPIPTAQLENAPFHLAYIREDSDAPSLIIVNPEGSGRREIRLPNVESGRSYGIWGLSPDGKYLAYHTGETASAGGDLTLHILRLEDEEKLAAIPLQTDDFGERMLELAERLAKDPPESLAGDWFTEDVFVDFILEDGIDAFEAGIRSLDWSPDGKLLAFAAQIDGPTSDVYTFNVNSGIIRRMTSGLTQVQYVYWSPNGEWIAHGSAFWVGMGTYMINNFVSREGSSVFSMDIGGQYGTWYGSELYLVFNDANGIGRFGLKVISMETQQVRALWWYPFKGYALDMPGGKLIVLETENLGFDEDGNLIGYPPGLYMVDLYTGTVEKIGEEDIDDLQWLRAGVWPWSRTGELALVIVGRNIMGVNNEGEVRMLIKKENGRPYPSPNGDRIAFLGYRDSVGIRVYDAHSEETIVLTEASASCVSWRPDGEGLAFKAGDVLFYSDLSGNASMIVDEEPGESWGGCNVMWLPGDQ
jgi:Tol biopolymer transport system component